MNDAQDAAMSDGESVWSYAERKERVFWERLRESLGRVIAAEEDLSELEYHAREEKYSVAKYYAARGKRRGYLDGLRDDVARMMNDVPEEDRPKAREQAMVDFYGVDAVAGKIIPQIMSEHGRIRDLASYHTAQHDLFDYLFDFTGTDWRVLDEYMALEEVALLIVNDQCSIAIGKVIVEERIGMAEMRYENEQLRERVENIERTLGIGAKEIP